MRAHRHLGPLLGLLMACSSNDAGVQEDAGAAPFDARKPNVVDFAWAVPGCMTSKLPQPGPQGEFLELCIPKQDAALAEVRAILAPETEQTGFLTQGGRIHCDTATQYLIVLDSSPPAEAVCALTQLSYVEKIAWTIINI